MKRFMKSEFRKNMPAAAVLLAVMLAALTAGCGINAAAPEAAGTVEEKENAGSAVNTEAAVEAASAAAPEKAENRKTVPADGSVQEFVSTRQEIPADPAAKERDEAKLLPDKEEKPAEEAYGDEENPGNEGPEAENGQDADREEMENGSGLKDGAPDSMEAAGLQAEEEIIVVPGLRGTYRYLFLSDTHIITLNGEETQQQLENALPRRDTLFLDPQGRMSEETFPDWIAYANEQKVDAVLLGGDIIDFPSQSNMDFLEENLEKLEMPVLYVPGNHDWTYPWEYMTEKGKNEYLSALAPFMRGTPAAQILENEELVLLGVDDSSNQIDPAALETVRKAVEKGKPVIVLQHVPFAAGKLIREAARVWKNPVALGMGAVGGIYPNEASQEYMKLVLGNASPVKAVLAGHIHMKVTDAAAENRKIMQYTAAPGYLGQGIMVIVTGDAPETVPESGAQEEAAAD